jgi:hypothetical protein
MTAKKSQPKLYNITTHFMEGRSGEYIGRGSPWGSPFIIGIDGNRNEVCNLFGWYALWRLKVQPHWLDFLKGQDLYCHCVPLRCHGETLLKLLLPKSKTKSATFKRIPC